LQPMPAKTRTALAVGAALLAVVVGGVAVWSARRGAEPLPRELDETSIIEPGAVPAIPTDHSAAPTGATQASGATPAARAGASQTAKIPAVVPASHVVAEGETLSSISRSYYGSNVYAGDIEALNELEDPNLLHAGQMLMLPKVEDLHKS